MKFTTILTTLFLSATALAQSCSTSSGTGTCKPSGDCYGLLLTSSTCTGGSICCVQRPCTANSLSGICLSSSSGCSGTKLPSSNCINDTQCCVQSLPSCESQGGTCKSYCMGMESAFTGAYCSTRGKMCCKPNGTAPTCDGVCKTVCSSTETTVTGMSCASGNVCCKPKVLKRYMRVGNQ